MVIDEMNKDLVRLLKVIDRFSKIGSSTMLSQNDVCTIIENCVNYFQTRIPKNVKLEFSKPEAPMESMINDALFEWVIENVIKNAIDALQGKGEISVLMTQDERHLYIDITDTGKGMPKASYKRIFEPGFTTKTRGWGLGLSLSRRIIEEYHKGKIAVVRSELGHGTTIRVTLKRREGDE
jgi:signal transduction histidine kinase